MTESVWVEASVVVIAFTMVCAAVAVTLILLQVRKTTTQVHGLLEGFSKDLGPIVNDLRDVTKDVAGIVDMAKTQAGRIDSSIDDTREKLVSTVDRLVESVDLLHESTYSSAAECVAAVKGISKGIQFFLRKDK